MAKKRHIVIPAHKEESYVNVSKEHGRERFIKQGAVAEISTSLGTSFLVPFAKSIGANALHIGFLSAFSGLLSPIGGIFGSKMMEHHSRKKIQLKFTLLQVLSTLLMLSVPLLYWMDIIKPSLPILLIFLYSVFVFASGVISPPFFSWIGDLVSEEERGKYFARRNRITGTWALIVFLIGGLILKFFEGRAEVLEGMLLLIGLSVVFRIISYYQIKKIYCPRFVIHKSAYFSVFQFLKRYDNFGKFAVFQAFFNFAIMVASPFFAVYMLNDLNFGIFTFTIISLSSTLFYLAFTPLAGKFSDRYGNLKLLYIAGFTFAMTPLLWVFSKNPFYLFFIPGMSAGIANAAYSISVTNFTYDNVRPEKRGVCVAHVGILVGIGVFLGSVLGGAMIKYLHISFMNTTLFVFLIATVLRIGVALFFLPQLVEWRKVRRIQGLSVDVHHPFRTVHTDVVWFKKFVHNK